MAAHVIEVAGSGRHTGMRCLALYLSPTELKRGVMINGAPVCPPREAPGPVMAHETAMPDLAGSSMPTCGMLATVLVEYMPPLDPRLAGIVFRRFCNSGRLDGV